MPLLSWDHTGVSDDNKTMFFKARFHDPYMLGLLTKKSDRLYVHMKYDLLDFNGHFRNETYDNKTYYEGMYLNCTMHTPVVYDPDNSSNTDSTGVPYYGCIKPNSTLSRVFPEECNADAELSPPA
jgi:hypothetical protein